MIIEKLFNRLYETNTFSSYFLLSLGTLCLLFIIILIIGIKDSKKKDKKENEQVEDLKDISFDMPSVVESINEDVTFEMPVLTKNLEDFKKNIEEEIAKENLENLAMDNDINTKKLDEGTKPFKILDIDEIEDTVIIPKINTTEV